MPIFIADFAFDAESETELSFSKGEIINVISQDTEWWYGEMLTTSGQSTGTKGWFVPAYGHIAVSVSPYSDLPAKQMVTKRTAVAMQIFKEEKEFVNTLKSFIDLVVEPIRLLDTPFKRSLMSDASVGLSLTLIQDIYAACNNFLEGIMGSSSAIEMADCYAQFAPSLQLFSQYTSENTKALNSLKAFSKQLTEFMSGVNMPQGLTIEYCLILPLNHYTKYAPAFQEFIWLTPALSIELPSLETALISLSEHSSLVDEKNREEEEAQQLLKLQYLFQGNPQIFKPTRKIIRMGDVEKVRKDKDGNRFSTKQYYAHLFNDVFIYSVKNRLSGTFKLHKVIDLDGAVVEKCSGRLPSTDVLSSLTNLFSLTASDTGEGERTEKVDMFRVDDTQELTLWMNSIQKQILTLKTEKLKNESVTAHAKQNKSSSILATSVDSSKLGKRAQVIHKFLESELEFSESMTSLNNIVVQPLLDASKGASLSTRITRAQAQQITSELQASNIQIALRAAEALTSAVRDFSGTLEGQCKHKKWDDSVAVAALLTSSASHNMFNQYKSYSSNHLQTLRVLKGVHFTQFYRDAEDSLAHISGSFTEKLDIPRNRPTHYLQFLKELQMVTPENHIDYPEISKALTILTSLTIEITDLVAAKKNFDRLLDIQACLISPHMFGSEPIIDNLASTARTFIKEGDLKKVCRKANKKFRFWLFSDMLIYGAENIGGNTFTFNRALQLTSCSVKKASDPSLQYAIEVLSTEKSFVILAPSESQMEDWIMRIMAAKVALGGNANEEEITAAPLWVPDATADTCRVCNETFGIFRRRHHCRRCGQLVCANHSSNKIILPNIHKTDQQRICDHCHDEYLRPRRASISANQNNSYSVSQKEAMSIAAASSVAADLPPPPQMEKSISSSNMNLIPTPPKPSSTATNSEIDSTMDDSFSSSRQSIGVPDMPPPPVPSFAPPSIPVATTSGGATDAVGKAAPRAPRVSAPPTSAPPIPDSLEPETTHAPPVPPAPAPAPAAAAPAAPAPPVAMVKPIMPDHIKPFQKMLDMRIAGIAVKNKMLQQGIKEEDADFLINGGYQRLIPSVVTVPTIPPTPTSGKPGPPGPLPGPPGPPPGPPVSAPAPPAPPAPPSTAAGSSVRPPPPAPGPPGGRPPPPAPPGGARPPPPAPAPPGQHPPAPAAAVPEYLVRWKKMQNLNIPEQAIRNKMRQEGISDKVVDSFFNGVYLPEDVSSSSGASAPSGPPLKGGPPPPPGPPIASSGGSLMDALKSGGHALKHTPPPTNVASQQGGGLMSAIRSGGAGLKKVDTSQIQEQKKNSIVNGGGMFNDLMAAMEKNRAVLQMENSDGSDSDSDNDFN